MLDGKLLRGGDSEELCLEFPFALLLEELGDGRLLGGCLLLCLHLSLTLLGQLLKG